LCINFEAFHCRMALGTLAAAHGDALAFGIVQLGLYAALLVMTPILCFAPKGIGLVAS
jgi:hypothetical protein